MSNPEITFTRSYPGGSVVQVDGALPPEATRADVLKAVGVSENPNMPRFKKFAPGADFRLTYFDD